MIGNNIPPLKAEDVDFHAKQAAFDFFNYNYIDWQAAERLSKKKRLDEAEQQEAIQILAALCRQRQAIGKEMLP